MKKKLIHKTYIRTFILIIALEIIVISINFFYAPINIAAGGATGIAILLDAAFGFNRALSVLIINVVMIIFAAIFLDKQVVRNITLGSFLLPVLMYITPSFKIVSDSLLAVIIGGATFAVGIATLYRIGASSGGTTVPPMILKKHFHINAPLSLLAIDLLVTFFNVFVAGLNAFFLAAFSLVITSFIMRYIEAGLDHKYQLHIMSQTKLDEIQEMILKEDHSLTVFDVHGGYSANQKAILMVVVDDQSYGPLVRRVHIIDPDAFIITSNVANVHGGRFGI
ncbi:YitT family protein [Liquorilactobacillus uvarum]|uniref:YitT family protein n=1 Tax=Liquorilactobacillus uvarum TaxID=303240 RepID=UPI00070F4B67|nr:YitT family protein [Liquorilactobacillus uvarum]